MAERMPRESAPVFVFAARTTCPRCGSDAVRAMRSIDNGDGSRTRNMRCATCGAPFILVIENSSDEIAIDSRIWNASKIETQNPHTMQIDIVSIGRAAVALQINPRRLERIATRIGVKPAARINGVLHFERTELDRIAAEAKQQHPTEDGK